MRGIWEEKAEKAFIITRNGDSMIHILREKALPAQITDMLKEYETMIKIVVDIRQHIVAGGGEMHVDCESVLLENGSEQDDLWGANWYVAEQRIEYESLNKSPYAAS